MNNLFSAYQRKVVIGESSIHDLFSSYHLIILVINKRKVILTHFRCVKLFSIRTAYLLK